VKPFRNTVNTLLVLILGLAASGLLAAESVPLRSVNKANEIIDAAIEAYGGAQALGEFNSLVVDASFKNHATNQSRGTEPPWDVSEQTSFNAIDLNRQFFYFSGSGSGGGFDFSGATLVDGDSGWQMDYRAGTAAPITSPDFLTSAGPFIRVTPALVIKQLMERRQFSHWLGTEQIDGRPHEIVTLVMEAGPGLSLYLDSETHLLSRMERVLPPIGQVEYRYSDYATVGSIPFNRSFHLLANGEPHIDSRVTSVRVNVPVDRWAEVPAALKRIDAQTPDDFNLQEIDEGVFLAGGNGAYGLLVEMDDYLVAIGGTQGARQRMEEVAKHSAKPVRYGALTHHHSDHVPGAADYAAAGATIIASKAHEGVVRAASRNDAATFEWVEGKMVLKGKSRSIEFHDIGPTSHSEHLLVAWLLEEKILFEADHFPQPLNGPLPPGVQPTRDLAAALKRLGLDFERIVGAHSSRLGTPADLKASLESQPVNIEPVATAP
jgi:glyoxylase-like metal-dependent hydrolase (beta-lactamase superfamily II)